MYIGGCRYIRILEKMISGIFLGLALQPKSRILIFMWSFRSPSRQVTTSHMLYVKTVAGTLRLSMSGATMGPGILYDGIGFST